MQLDNPYSMSTIDLCPVGALTSRDFRFKARVWEMSATETVCPGCSRGCNILAWVRNNEILRLTPRHNPHVNDDWMCDNGRLQSFRHVNTETRVKNPAMKKDQDWIEVGWDEAVARVASEFKAFKKSEIAVVASARCTNEDLFVLRKFAHEVVGTKLIGFPSHIVEGDEDQLLIRSDKTPNSRGASELGLHTGTAYTDVITAVREGKVKALLVVQEDIAADSAIASVLARLEFLVVTASNESATTRMADVVLPASTFAEKHGTFTNFEGRVQRIRPSVAVIDRERSLDGFQMSRLDRFGSQFDRWARGVKRDARPIWRIVAGIALLMGVKYRYTSAEEVFQEIAATVAGFRGMSYRTLGNKGTVLAARASAVVSG
jgi:NADH-quinone oxidoreductase subunit G